MSKELNLTLLGSGATDYPTEYAPHILERIPNNHTTDDYLVTLDCPEFTSLCPITNQPDFGKIVIKYIPGDWLVESKSLKLYMFSFRSHGEFHENCVNVIKNDLQNLLQTKFIEVKGYFNPRGGISIIPTAVYADAEHKRFADKSLMD
jgi:7-cyano-7-deazaguanine reductase